MPAESSLALGHVQLASGAPPRRATGQGFCKWPAGLAAGGYEVAYRVASGDGHPVTGSVAFSVTTESALAPPSGATPFAPDPAPSEPAAAEAGGVSIYPFLLVFLLVVAIAGVAVTLRRGRR